MSNKLQDEWNACCNMWMLADKFGSKHLRLLAEALSYRDRAEELRDKADNLWHETIIKEYGEFWLRDNLVDVIWNGKRFEYKLKNGEHYK